MKHIKHNIKTNNYHSGEFNDNYAYIKTTNKDMDIHHIFHIVGIDLNDDSSFIVNKYYYFCIPYKDSIKCFCYDGTNKFTYSYKDELYIMTVEEYLNTFREFIKNDGKYPKDIPSKIIQDIVN